MLTIGQTVGNYRVVRRLGRGAMGTVFEARHLVIDRRSAIKVASGELQRDPEFVARFLNEARAANRVRHPGLLEIYEYGNLPDGPPYLVMELLEGQSLEERLGRGRRLPPAIALDVARQIASALAVAHENGIVHRDLKPANVMLVADPEWPDRERVKILDFGIAKVIPKEGFSASDSPLTITGVAMGTPGYMAPEQCTGAARVDGQADVYALGIMLYEMLGGRRPFIARAAVEVMSMHLRQLPPPLERRVPGLPAEVVALVNQMLAKHPPQRPTMREVESELKRLSDAPAERRAIVSTGPAIESGPTMMTMPPAPLDDCPFLVGPPVTDPRRFFGRRRILGRLAGLWRRTPLQNAAIIGPRRSGKTSLLLRLHSYVNERSIDSSQSLTPRFCYLDFQDPRLAKPEVVLGQLLRGLGLGAADERCTMERFIDVVAEGLRSPAVVLLDEMDVALARYEQLDDRFWEGLRALATNQVEGNLAFVLGCHVAPSEVARQSRHGSPFFNIFGYSATLGPFEPDEADALLDSSPRPLSPPDRAFILEQSARWPILLQVLCRERFLSLQEGDGSDSWRQEALHQLTPFRHLLNS